MTQRLAAAAARHPWRTVGAWLVACVLAIVAIVFFLGDALTGEAEQLNNPESEQAYTLMAQRLPPDPTGGTTDVILIRSNREAVGDADFRAKVDEVLERLRATPGVYYVRDKPAAQTRHAVVYEAGLEDDSAGDNVIDLVRSEDDQTFDVLTTGAGRTAA